MESDESVARYKYQIHGARSSFDVMGPQIYGGSSWVGPLLTALTCHYVVYAAYVYGCLFIKNKIKKVLPKPYVKKNSLFT